MRINTNVSSLAAQEANLNTNKTLQSSLEKLGTGLRINKAADDASGLAIADKLRTQASSIGQGIANGNSASALIQIADKAMAEQTTILDTVKTKLIQAATATTSAEGREAIRKDINKLLNQFDNIAAQTNYNGTTLLQQSATDTAKQSNMTFQLGEDSSFDVTLSQTSASNTKSLGGGATTVSTGSNVMAQESIKLQDTDGTIEINAKHFSSDGSEIHSANVIADFDINFTGNMGRIDKASGTTIVFDFSSQTDEIKELAKALAGDSSDQSLGYTSATYNASTDTLTLLADTNTANSSSQYDFSALDISDVRVTITAAESTETISMDVTNSEGFSIKNNTTDVVDGVEAFLNLTGTMTGGDLLSSIKDLAADGLTNAKANDFMVTVDEALSQLNTNRADFGSSQNQIESSLRNMQTTQTNLKAAESVIRDVDYASESAMFNKQNIIAQAGTYAMSQANAVSQNVLRLLQ